MLPFLPTHRAQRDRATKTALTSSRKPAKRSRSRRRNVCFGTHPATSGVSDTPPRQLAGPTHTQPRAAAPSCGVTPRPYHTRACAGLRRTRGCPAGGSPPVTSAYITSMRERAQAHTWRQSHACARRTCSSHGRTFWARGTCTATALLRDVHGTVPSVASTCRHARARAASFPLPDDSKLHSACAHKNALPCTLRVNYRGRRHDRARVLVRHKNHYLLGAPPVRGRNTNTH
jgi:hypothetical protein